RSRSTGSQRSWHRKRGGTDLLHTRNQVALQTLARLEYELAQRWALNHRPLDLPERTVEALEGFDRIAQLDVGWGLDVGQWTAAAPVVGEVDVVAREGPEVLLAAVFLARREAVIDDAQALLGQGD